jgi:hypothetical protein
MRAANWLGTAKPNDHQDAWGRAGRREETDSDLTWGDLFDESRGEVSRGRSSEEVCDKQTEPRAEDRKQREAKLDEELAATGRRDT